MTKSAQSTNARDRNTVNGKLYLDFGALAQCRREIWARIKNLCSWGTYVLGGHGPILDRHDENRLYGESRIMSGRPFLRIFHFFENFDSKMSYYIMRTSCETGIPLDDRRSPILVEQQRAEHSL